MSLASREIRKVLENNDCEHEQRERYLLLCTHGDANKDPIGKWLIEGWGAEPDITVDALPHATFAGEDPQLEAALKLLKEQIKADPRPVPQHPPYPDKSFKF